VPLSQRWIAQGLQSWQVALHHLDRLAQRLHHLKAQSQASVETRQLLRHKLGFADCLHVLPPAVVRLICIERAYMSDWSCEQHEVHHG